MLGWAIAFVIAAIIVAFMGLMDTATTFIAMSKVVTFIFTIGFVLSLAMHFARRRSRA